MIRQDNILKVQRLGYLDYQQAWDHQTALFEEMLEVKLSNRDLPAERHLPTDQYLLLVEHPPVFTIGKSGKKENLLADAQELRKVDAKMLEVNRGGDITFHGPGQLVVYPLLDLDRFFTDIHRYMRYLEECVIITLAHYGLKGERYPGFTGVWLDADQPEKARKICAMGVKASRWVTMHGLALNVNTDLAFFKLIVPCGIEDKAVTSIEKELGHKVPLKEVEELFLQAFAQQFEVSLEETI
jgi:lipoyl(octanoyl) transferase